MRITKVKGSPSENRNEGEERGFHARMVVRIGRAEVRLLTQSSLQASAAYLPLTATTEKFAAIQLAPDSGSRRVNDLKVVFRFLTIFQAINKNIHCDCFKAFTKTIHAMNLFLLPPPQSSIYQGSNIKIPF